jgi:hypothetical protein
MTNIVHQKSDMGVRIGTKQPGFTISRSKLSTERKLIISKNLPPGNALEAERRGDKQNQKNSKSEKGDGGGVPAFPIVTNC